MRRPALFRLLAAMVTVAFFAHAEMPKRPVAAPDAKPASARKAPRGAPKPLSATVKKGLDWLARSQLPNGAWGEGEHVGHAPETLDAVKRPVSTGLPFRGDRRVRMGRPVHAVEQGGNVADSGMTMLALLRSGSTPKAGEYAGALRKGSEYLLGEIEASDADSLSVTRVQGTRVQSKIGAYVDTFIAAAVLTELKGRMQDADANARVEKALAKVLAKIEKNQRQDGTFAGDGWAPVLSQAMASKAVNRANRTGAKVDRKVLERMEQNARASATPEGRFAAAPTAAGVDLYAQASGLGALAEAKQTNDADESKYREQAKSAPTEAQRREAKEKLADIEQTRRAQQAAVTQTVDRLSDPSFIAGFGSNGGEEFLSYMLVSESLFVEGGKAWEEWDAKMAENLTRVQNGDGSWTGHHCITGRNFCTAAALLVLMTDRAHSLVAGQLAG